MPETPDLEIYYMKILTPNMDARLGKLQEGQIVGMTRAQATRYLTTRVAEQASQADFEAQQNRKQEKATAAQKAFQAINDGHAMWDVSTYRDVLTAPEGGLRLAFERGIPLVNVHLLRDEDGDPLPPDADIEDILDARQNLHPDMTAPFASHERSSVMGGGSPYVSNTSGLDQPAPLSPAHRAAMERVAENEKLAQQSPLQQAQRGAGAGAGGNAERAGRAGRRATQRVPVSPEAEGAAAQAGVVAPSGDLTPEQQA